MATTSKALILRDIRTTLAAIDGTGSYKTTVDTVDPFLRSRDEVKNGERPYIGFGVDQETIEHYPFTTMRIQLPLTVVGYVKQAEGEVWDDNLDAINDLRDDIIYALFLDHTLGGSCTNIQLVSSLDDTADPNRRDISQDGGAVVLNFMITYHRDTGAS